jgi:hypothetical protein
VKRRAAGCCCVEKITPGCPTPRQFNYFDADGSLIDRQTRDTYHITCIFGWAPVDEFYLASRTEPGSGLNQNCYLNYPQIITGHVYQPNPPVGYFEGYGGAIDWDASFWSQTNQQLGIYGTTCQPFNNEIFCTDDQGPLDKFRLTLDFNPRFPTVEVTASALRTVVPNGGDVFVQGPSIRTTFSGFVSDGSDCGCAFNDLTPECLLARGQCPQDRLWIGGEVVGDGLIEACHENFQLECPDGVREACESGLLPAEVCNEPRRHIQSWNGCVMDCSVNNNGHHRRWHPDLCGSNSSNPCCPDYSGDVLGCDCRLYTVTPCGDFAYGTGTCTVS